MKPLYQRRSLTDGTTKYYRNGDPITAEEFNRDVPVARKIELRTMERGYCHDSKFWVGKKQPKRSAEDQALLDLVAAKLRS